MKQNQVKWGVIFSYLLIGVNTLYGLLITPFVIRYLGDGDYGVYKTISSLSASLAVMDLGFGATMTRYMAKYHAQGDRKSANNFAAMVFVQCAVLAVLILVVGIGAYFSLDKVYGNSFLPTQMVLAKRLLVVLVLNIVLRFFENLLTGIANGHERFAFSNGIKLLSVLLKFSLILIVLPICANALLIVLLETAIVSIVIGVLLVYIVKNVGVKPKLVKWENAVFRESMGYTLLMFAQTITIQFNGNVDNVLIGAKLGATSVTVYSMALAIFGMYENLSGSIANIMLPNMAKRVEKGQNAEQLQAGVEQAGRFQFVLLGAALGGFAVLGDDFYRLWLGNGFEDCYLLTLLLIIPVTFPMMQNVALSILRAQNKMLYRTITLLVSCVINVVVTLVGLEFFGYWGAAIGTACATLANLIFMNVYYRKHLKFKIFRMFANIVSRTWICAALASGAIAILKLCFHGTWISFITSAAAFVAIYGVLLFAWGLKNNERELLIGRFVRK